MTLLIILGVTGLGALALAVATYSSQRKRKTKVHTSGARTDTRAQLSAMSDLILDLEPRIIIADEPALKERFATASRIYSDVLTSAEAAKSGHEVADLRLQIANARWRLDVVEAELDGRKPPPEPFGRDTTGSAWDSTRGTGGEV